MTAVRRTLRYITPSLSFVLVVAPALGAQGNASNSAYNPQEILKTEKYVKPPANVETHDHGAARGHLVLISPNADRSWFLRGVGEDRGDIMAYGKPHIYLGGLQVDTKANRVAFPHDEHASQNWC